MTMAMSRLHIDEHGYSQSRDYSTSSRNLGSPTKLFRRDSVSTGFQEAWPQMSSQEIVLFEEPENSEVALSQTAPLHLPIPPNRRRSLIPTPSSPSKASPTKASYLTKESDIPSLIEWTPDAKLKEMMEYFDQIKADSGKPNPLEEAVSLYKQQSEFFVAADDVLGLTSKQ
jgi:hypothetical protein